MRLLIFLVALACSAPALAGTLEGVFVGTLNGNLFDADQPITAGNDLDSTNAIIGAIQGIAPDGPNSVFIAEQGAANRLRRLNLLTGASTIIDDDLSGNALDLAVDGGGNLYLSNQNAGLVYRYAAGTLTRTTLVSGLNAPRGLFFDAALNRLLLVEQAGNVESAGRLLDITSGTASVIASGFTSAIDVVVAANGDILVSEAVPNRIRNVTQATNLTSAQFDTPHNLAISAAGDLLATQNNGLLNVTQDTVLAVTGFGSSRGLFAEAAVPEPSLAALWLLAIPVAARRRGRPSASRRA